MMQRPARFLWILPIALTMAANVWAQSDPWTPLRVLEGRWSGPTSGKPGKGSTTREYQFVLGGHFFSQHDISVYQPDAANTPPVTHEDLGYFSYDGHLKKVVWRQFHNEGLVNEYTLECVSADGKTLQFRTTRIENLEPGWRAKKVYRVLSRDEIEETFWLAAPGKDFEPYTQAHLKRVQ